MSITLVLVNLFYISLMRDAQKQNILLNLVLFLLQETYARDIFSSLPLYNSANSDKKDSIFFSYHIIKCYSNIPAVLWLVYTCILEISLMLLEYSIETLGYLEYFILKHFIFCLYDAYT